MSIASSNWGSAASNRQAIATISIGIFFLVVNDVMAKWLTDFYDPLQIIFVRSVLVLPLIATAIWFHSGRSAFRTRHLRVHILRGVLIVCAAYTFFSSLKVLPLAEATCLVFAAPLFITALSVVMFGEQVGWRRWAAILVGFAGVLVVIRPGAAVFQMASLLPVATALFYALLMLSTRLIDKSENIWTMMFYLVLLPILLCGPIVIFFWTPIDPAHLPYFFGTAICSALGGTLISHAFRLAPAAIVAPFDYTALIWASLFGWLFWSEVPGPWLFAGAAIIIASGIYIVYREARSEPEKDGAG